jgi:hypothetical protein
MNDIARQLRAQIPSSTDPGRLERMAREAEGWASRCQQPTQARRFVRRLTTDLGKIAAAELLGDER